MTSYGPDGVSFVRLPEPCPAQQHSGVTRDWAEAGGQKFWQRFHQAPVHGRVGFKAVVVSASQ